jgi:CheY-like chemotaxis protein
MDEIHFLYVEDDPMSRMVMEMLLKRGLGYQNIVIFENSQNFDVRINQLTAIPHIVFLDIHMQPIDGFEMLKRLRALPDFADSRIIALTASVMNEEVDLLQTAGFDGVLSKPLDQTLFPTLLKRILLGEEVWHVV